MSKFGNNISNKLSYLYQIIALLVTVAMILVMFPLADRSSLYTYEAGSFWAYDDLYAPADFTVGKSEKDIANEKVNARREAFLYFVADSTAANVARHNIDNSTLSWNDKRMAYAVTEAIYKQGLIEQPSTIDNLDGSTIILLDGNVGSEHKANDFVNYSQIEQWVESFHWGNNPEEVEANANILRDNILVPSIRHDALRTQLELDSRLSQINYASHMVQKGELVVQKGQYLDADKVLEIDALVKLSAETTHENFNNVNHYLGQLLLSIIAFIALYFFLKNTNHYILEDNRKVSFVFVTVLLMSGIVALVERINPNWVLLAPVCIVPIMMRVFFDMRVALYIHLTVVIILGNLVPNSYEFIFYQLVTGIMSIVTVKEFDNRRDFFAVSLTIFLVYSLIYTAGILSQDTTLANIAPERYLIFFLNALLTLLSYPLIYLFERLFSMTTDLTLLEISSTNTPALRELSRTAPGTFQHSMQVANISEDIINEIGGNALLARVGGLYHDIGKTTAPFYFTENQDTGYNPHSDLDFEESARIITNHVKDGLKLAQKYRLPSDITDFIRTHHGTTRTGYFYAMWKQQHPDEEPEDNMFRYGGPRPYSRETAVVMIVDSVEAATKSLREPTRDSIERMVNSIVDSKVAEHQLDECDLTLKDITSIRSLLIEKIASVHHVRVAYPTK